MYPILSTEASFPFGMFRERGRGMEYPGTTWADIKGRLCSPQTSDSVNEVVCKLGVSQSWVLGSWRLLRRKLGLGPRTNRAGYFWVGEASVLSGRQGVVAWAGASDELGIPQAFQESENWGGVCCLCSLVLCWLQRGSPGQMLPTADTVLSRELT